MHDTPVHIRNARADERDAIQALTIAAYAQYESVMGPLLWADYYQVVLHTLAADGIERIVAESNGELIGSVLLFPTQQEPHDALMSAADPPEIRTLAVAPAARGRGIGLALVEECICRARSQGAAVLGLHTADSMPVAMHLYERLGFVRVPARDFYPPHGPVVKAYELALT